jgi:hypothetical protein
VDSDLDQLAERGTRVHEELPLMRRPDVIGHGDTLAGQAHTDHKDNLRRPRHGEQSPSRLVRRQDLAFRDSAHVDSLWSSASQAGPVANIAARKQRRRG